MSEGVVVKLNSFKNYRYEATTNRIVNLKGVNNADMDEFLAIAHILDSNYIKYKFSTNIDIRIIGKR
ncbi:hypothetical protein CRV08_09700 [Halarcobacter ebronensis]|uniref:Uncharacterized protein n=1 Tax=Halarcobacter ebronensis TaxID=1462615 RepID=A0A4Q0YDJ8_9BACT|nr:hypothetical protein [Halarcobacter ebronensis]QKF81274.1 hypothetical protein AEBR_0774 [Halarcobacter ebronensis]RXJ67634.1 hypothetical protein CRV08_09700 [Halarcobacter ebronensis]RXK04840.1 hypothetical protein CRV07_09630 [Halarcobacter ebronensis]